MPRPDTETTIFLILGGLATTLVALGVVLVVFAFVDLSGDSSADDTTGEEASIVVTIDVSDHVAALATIAAAPTREPRVVLVPTASGDTMADSVSVAGDPVIGEELFNTFQPEAGFACSTCHRVDSEDELIGPGQLNISLRAATRVEGQTAEEYIRQSIINPDAYVVEGFADDLMPENWADIYSEDDITNIIAYLFTLVEEGAEPAAVANSDDVGFTDEELGGGDPINGEVLFGMFQPAASFACSTCHRADSEDELIGPGQLNIGTRAATRVEGQTALQYIYTSIINPDAYVVEGFADDLMPENWADIYSFDEIRDIMAYLLTLE